MPIDAAKKRLHDAYGVEFPDDLFAFAAFVSELDVALLDELDLRLGGVFDVLSGHLDPAMVTRSPLLHFRFSFDPPEFFTVLLGSDGLHYGYWFDDPARKPPVLCSYCTRGAYHFQQDGDTLFELMRLTLEDCYGEQPSEQLDALREQLRGFPGCGGRGKGEKYQQRKGRRAPAVMTSEGMGIVCDRRKYRPLALPFDAEGDQAIRRWVLDDNDVAPMVEQALEAADQGFPGTALWLGRELWGFADRNAQAQELLARAYADLDRPALSRVLRTHCAERWLDSVDITQA